MTQLKMFLFALVVLAIAACQPAKKSSTTTPASPGFFLPSAGGVHEPGPEEQTAISIRFSGTTLDKLREGYAIYTKGECVKCHRPENIYIRGEDAWKGIIDNMARKAFLSDSQKDAVYKYVLSIKATQPK